MIEFLSFTEFQHYVTGVYMVVGIGILGLTVYILVNSQRQRSRLSKLQKQLQQAGRDK